MERLKAEQSKRRFKSLLILQVMALQNEYAASQN